MTDTIHLYGDIGSSVWFEGISSKDVLQALRELDTSADKHYVRINSPGGLVDEGLTIMNVLLAHKRTLKAFNPNFQLETICDGYAMSAASVIFMAGDIRTVSLGGVIMIHDAWSYVGGSAETMREVADSLDKISQSGAEVYATLCTPAKERTADYFRELMKKETYLVKDEAVDVGIATRVDNNSEAVLINDLTPEKLKGHYVERMTKERTKTTFKPPIDSAKLKQKQSAFQSLQALAAELGQEIKIP